MIVCVCYISFATRQRSVAVATVLQNDFALHGLKHVASCRQAVQPWGCLEISLPPISASWARAQTGAATLSQTMLRPC